MYEYVQLHLLFHFFVFIDVISGVLCQDERRQLAEWESLPHNYENYFFLCLHSSNRHVNVDLWLLDEQQRELLSELPLSIFLFTVCTALCLAHLRQIALFLCASAFAFPDLSGQIFEAEFALALCLSLCLLQCNRPSRSWRFLPLSSSTN